MWTLIVLLWMPNKQYQAFGIPGFEDESACVLALSTMDKPLKNPAVQMQCVNAKHN
jgi:hypothetical protein